MAQQETVGIFIDSKADLKGFKQAETAAQKLNKTIKNLATTVGVAYGTKAVINFGNAAVKAFSEDQAAAVRLATAVDNLGMSFANPAIAKFIDDLQIASGIVDDKLRPAFQALLTTTKSVTDSQTLLRDAINISRASGIDLATVAQDLANGYVGITRGLKKYNTGLSQAELKTKSFSEVLSILNQQTADASQKYLTTTAYKLDVLSVASQNAKEAIGSGLVDALARVGGGTDVQSAVQAINNITTAVNGVTMAIGTVLGGFVKLYRALDWIGHLGGLIPSVEGKKNNSAKALADLNNAKNVKLQTKATIAQTKAQKALTAEQKKQNSLKKSSTVFDMDQIQLVAALKGKLTEEEQNRVKALLALQNDNADAAKYYSDLVVKAQDDTGRLAALIRNLPTAKNPFADWVAPANMTTAQAVSYTNSATGAADLATQQALAAIASLDPIAAMIDKVLNNPPMSPSDIKLYLDSKEIATAVQNQALNGNASTINRAVGNFSRVTNT